MTKNTKNIEKKKCKDCNEEKTLDNFYHRKDRNYYLPRCINCQKIYIGKKNNCPNCSCN